jgi:hypothetical protein
MKPGQVEMLDTPLNLSPEYKLQRGRWLDYDLAVAWRNLTHCLVRTEVLDTLHIKTRGLQS